jgi:hypothetical protein
LADATMDRFRDMNHTAIDDPLSALVKIISGQEGGSAAAKPSQRMPKWLSRELAAARAAGASIRRTRGDQVITQRAARDIEFAVSHPTQFALGVPFFIHVLIYRESDRRLAVLRAAEVGSGNDHLATQNTDSAQRSTKFSVAMGLPWLTEATRTVRWDGALRFASFKVMPPKYATSKTVHGSCEFSIEGLTVGLVYFELQFSQDIGAEDRHISRAETIKTAFASCARRDRRRVLPRIRAVERLGIDVVLDDKKPRDDDQSRERVFRAIDSSDILYLFWSPYARRSIWIEREWRYALQKKGAGFVNPVPLDSPDRAPPPIELGGHKHFRYLSENSRRWAKQSGVWTVLQSWLLR